MHTRYELSRLHHQFFPVAFLPLLWVELLLCLVLARQMGQAWLTLPGQAPQGHYAHWNSREKTKYGNVSCM